MELIYIWLRMKDQGSLELAVENKNFKGIKKNDILWFFFSVHLVQIYMIVVTMNVATFNR